MLMGSEHGETGSKKTPEIHTRAEKSLDVIIWFN
jgi:hypothetical protein